MNLKATAYQTAKRVMDVVGALFGVPVLLFPMLLIAIIIKLSSKGPAIHWSKRVGKNNSQFMMAKFRTMYVDTPQVATHLMVDPQRFVTPIGRFLRRYSFDELPQLLNILRGDLSIVGPRPALFNQDDLVALRTEKGIHTLKPGLTGWAQVNGRDELAIPVKVALDEFYLRNRSIWFDIKIIFITIKKALTGEGVSH